jgi:hypothetical protein
LQTIEKIRSDGVGINGVSLISHGISGSDMDNAGST